ncbi:uncharacterized protein LOC110810851 isoform X1 [Carica papaya]|uniref:uncharacterized protein LOC110810851 isoform X1 n=1 Tax=Carica papaya TaxID=3649 RepID=UPI000B8D0DBF|nr:uncharacterized protein LOC110810851 isoform X1 [Carica papaya]
MGEFGEIFDWISILWKRGFRHDNPQVRCIIMQSFLSIEWINYGCGVKSVPENFILGILMEALNDPVHHKDFGVKGVYTTKTIGGAALFLRQYAKYLNERQQVVFLINLASLAKQQSFGRAGLMCLAECITSSACGVGTHSEDETKGPSDVFPDKSQVESPAETGAHDNKTNLLDVLRFIVESSKQHFNPNYRLQVCQKLLEAASSVVHVCDVPLEVLLHFLSAFPQEFTDYNGPLCVSLREWFSGCTRRHSSDSCDDKMCILRGLHDFPKRFINRHYMVETFDDEDLQAWEFQTRRWARVLFPYIKEEQHLDPIFMFIKHHGLNICKENSHLERLPVKFLILLMSLVLEIQIILEATAEFGVKNKNKSDICFAGTMTHSFICQKFANVLFSILEELVSFANLSSSIFHLTLAVEDTTLPNSIRGKLGGPSQRRLSTSTTTAVLQAQ